MTRDKLVARLWPESDDDRARRNLSQLLYSMRTELGAELVEGTSTVRLDPAQCWSDVAAFDVAIADGRDADALALYQGPFLDGFHLSDSSEFSQWADAERDRRATVALAAAVRVAEASARGDAGKRAHAWRRVVALDPLNSRFVLQLQDALVADGDRLAAIRVAEQYVSRVRTELEVEPDAAVVQRLNALRRDGSTPALGVAAAAPAPAAVRPDELSAPQATVAASSSRPRWYANRRIIALGAVALAVLASVAAWNRSSTALGDDEYVLLSQFVNSTSDTLLTRSVSTAVAAALQQSAHVVQLPRARMAAALKRMERRDTTEWLDVETAREVARREGVRFVIAGDVHESGSTRQLTSRIIESATGRVAASRTFRIDSESDVLSTIDLLVRAMRRDLGEARASVAAALPLPDVTTHSLLALDYYARGLEANRDDNDALGATLFRSAVELDSNFASAHAYLGQWYNYNNRIPEATYHYGRALAQVYRLPPEEQLRIRGMAALAQGDYANAVEYTENLVSLRPRDPAAWSRLAYALFSSGRYVEARSAYAKADSLIPLSAVSVLNIGTSWMSSSKTARDTVGFDSARVYYQRAFAQQPELEYSAYYNQQYGSILLATGRPDSARATFDRMTARGSTGDRARGLRSNAFLDAMEGNWRSAAERFAQAAELTVSGKQWTSAIRNDALYADLQLVLGNQAAAARALQRATTISLREPLEVRALAFVALAQVKAGHRAAAVQLLERMRASARPTFAAEQAAILSVEGALALADGRPTESVAALRAAALRDSSYFQSRMLLARAMAAAGDDSAAAALWAGIDERYNFGLEGQFDWELALYERGLLLERMGQVELATTAYRRLLERFPTNVTSEPPALTDARRRLTHLERGGR